MYTRDDWDEPGIYQCRNLKTGHVYIGSSIKSCHSRRYNHVSKLRNNIHTNGHLQNAWNKHGEDLFVWEILEIVYNRDKDKIRSIEQEYINNAPTGKLYNIKFTVQPYAPKSKRGLANIKEGFRLGRIRSLKRVLEYIQGIYSPDDVLTNKYYYTALNYIKEINELKLKAISEKADMLLTYENGVYPDNDDDILTAILNY